MSKADFYEQLRTEAQGEMLESGRRRMCGRLTAICGRGSSVQFDGEQRDVTTGAVLDQFIVQSAGSVFDTTMRSKMERIGERVDYFNNGTTAHVKIDQLNYDTRCFRLDFTSDQWRTLCMLTLLIMMLFGALLYVEHYRTEHVGFAASHDASEM